MKKENCPNYFLGLDIGTDSVGYAVTDTSPEYNLLTQKGDPMWGVTLFEEANLKADRRAFRTARRRLDRRQQRVHLIQQLFADEIAKADPRFYQRISESALLRADSNDLYCLFADADFTDKTYHKTYPTIHHLLSDLMKSDKPKDVRLVYLACAWLVAHRGHFLSEISEDNVESVTDFTERYKELLSFFETSAEESYAAPWTLDDPQELAAILKDKTNITTKQKKLVDLLCGGKKPSKTITSPEHFPFSLDGIIRLMSGGQAKIADLFGNDEYDDLGSVSLGMAEEKFEDVLAQLGDDGMLLVKLKAIADWALLADILAERDTLSDAKVAVYEQHQKDLRYLKAFLRKYKGKAAYADMFRRADIKGNYVSYCGNLKSVKGNADKFKACTKEDFCKYTLSLVNGVAVEAKDKPAYEDMLARLGKDVLSFMPKQVDGDNRVIPYQLYYSEMKTILKNASKYLPFLSQKDGDGFTPAEKALSVMKFRIPYFVGPLNTASEHGWLKRKAEGKIYPWNFEQMVDLDACEEEFINRMTNTCSYLPDEDVLPKHSLVYEKFEVLNEINNLRVEGTPISVEAKQAVYEEFRNRKKMSPKTIKAVLVCGNFCTKEAAETLSGIDESVKSSLSSYHAFRRLLESGTLTEDEAEDIIVRRTYSESKYQFGRWLEKNYAKLSEADRRYVCSLSFKDFGRLSRKFLCGFEGTNTETGEVDTILGFLWNTNENLSELVLSKDKYTFRDQIAEFAAEYYSDKPRTLEERLDEMYVSNAVKRPIIRTLDIVRDVVKATGRAPETIFVEMARGASEDQKGKRTKSRRDQLTELYKKVSDDTKELSKLLESKTDSELQSESLFLYFAQLGKCMYTGEEIIIENLKSGTYNIEHIYPQSKVADDSILNNKVLVLSEANGAKSDTYPIAAEIRHKMRPFWEQLRSCGLITEEKFNRLTRSTPFTDEEKWGFINRQLVETRQSTKVVTELLTEKYPETKIVYVKAGLASDFRHEQDLLKSRLVNDLHHAKDAYLNIVCGNVYHSRFTKQWFLANKEKYTINQKVLYGNPVIVAGKTVWNGGASLDAVKKTMRGNRIHMTRYCFCRHGGLFDQMPVSAAEGLIPRKAGLPTEQYGGYNRPTISFFILADYQSGKKKDRMLVPVRLLDAQRFLNDLAYANAYVGKQIAEITGKPIDTVALPFGLRPIKINTLFSFDGFLCSLAGSSGGNKCVIMAPFMPLLLPADKELYVKRLEVFCEKCKASPAYRYSKEYDKISSEENVELYALLCEKYQNSIFRKRPNAPLDTLLNGKETFAKLDIKDQSAALLNVIMTFGRVSSGCDLSGIGGGTHSAATVNVSATLSNWKKNYQQVCLIDRSASGLWEKQSVNLLEFA